MPLASSPQIRAMCHLFKLVSLDHIGHLDSQRLSQTQPDASTRSTWRCSTRRPIEYRELPEAIFNDWTRPVRSDLTRPVSTQHWSPRIRAKLVGPDDEQCSAIVRSLASAPTKKWLDTQIPASSHYMTLSSFYAATLSTNLTLSQRPIMTCSASDRSLSPPFLFLSSRPLHPFF
jgi:hypothetical protein